MGPIRRPRVFNGPLVKPREPGRFGDLARMMVLGMLLVLPFFLFASLRAQLQQYRTEVVDLEAHIKQLDEQRQRLLPQWRPYPNRQHWEYVSLYRSS